MHHEPTNRSQKSPSRPDAFRPVSQKIENRQKGGFWRLEFLLEFSLRWPPGATGALAWPGAGLEFSPDWPKTPKWPEVRKTPIRFNGNHVKTDWSFSHFWPFWRFCQKWSNFEILPKVDKKSNPAAAPPRELAPRSRRPPAVRLGVSVRKTPIKTPIRFNAFWRPWSKQLNKVPPMSMAPFFNFLYKNDDFWKSKNFRWPIFLGVVCSFVFGIRLKIISQNTLKNRPHQSL